MICGGDDRAKDFFFILVGCASYVMDTTRWGKERGVVHGAWGSSTVPGDRPQCQVIVHSAWGSSTVPGDRPQSQVVVHSARWSSTVPVGRPQSQVFVHSASRAVCYVGATRLGRSIPSSTDSNPVECIPAPVVEIFAKKAFFGTISYGVNPT